MTVKACFVICFNESIVLKHLKKRCPLLETIVWNRAALFVEVERLMRQKHNKQNKLDMTCLAKTFERIKRPLSREYCIYFLFTVMV